MEDDMTAHDLAAYIAKLEFTNAELLEALQFIEKTAQGKTLASANVKTIWAIRKATRAAIAKATRSAKDEKIIPVSEEMTFETALKVAGYLNEYSTSDLREAFNILMAEPSCKNTANLILCELEKRTN